MVVPTLQRTRDGLERVFGVNHVAHALLAQLLAPALEASAAASGDARVVVVSSGAAWWGDVGARSPALLDPLYAKGRRHGFLGISEYGNSKLANAVFAAELARRSAGTGLRAWSLHPGAVYTALFDSVPYFGALERLLGPLLRFVFKTPLEGAQTQLYLATAPLAEVGALNGRFFDNCAPAWMKSIHSEEVGRALWRVTDELTSARAADGGAE